MEQLAFGGSQDRRIHSTTGHPASQTRAEFWLERAGIEPAATWIDGLVVDTIETPRRSFTRTLALERGRSA